MNRQVVKVFNDGNNYIGSFIGSNLLKDVKRDPQKNFTYEERARFRRYYKEANMQKLKGKKRKDFIMLSSMENDVSTWFDDEKTTKLLKLEINNAHKREKRCIDKLNFNPWNYFITFTYDNEKETEEGFVKRLRKALSNFSTRNGWRYVGVRERGEDGGRTHYHFITYIPDGEMVGDLFLDRKYSTKRRRWEYFTNNTYFQERFGQCRFDVLTDDDIRAGRVTSYIRKYLQKNDERIIYSRHIPDHVELEIDLDDDVLLYYRRYVIRCILNERNLNLRQRSNSFENAEYSYVIMDKVSYSELNFDELLTIR